MNFLSKIFNKQKNNSADLAKNRLKVSIKYEKNILSNSKIKKLQEQILDLIKNYDIENNTILDSSIRFNNNNNLEIEISFNEWLRFHLMND